jgi:hypothetical protein
MRVISFSQKLQAGASSEELKKYYALSPSEYQRIISCLQELKLNSGEKK